MRIFLFALSIVSLLLAAHQFSLTEQTGQFKGALFFLLIGIQLLIAGALVQAHQEERSRKPLTSSDKGVYKESAQNEVNASLEQEKRS